MKGTRKGLSMLLLTTMLTTLLAACSSNKTSNENTDAPGNTGANAAQTSAGSGGTPDPVTLKVMLFGESRSKWTRC